MEYAAQAGRGAGGGPDGGLKRHRAGVGRAVCPAGREGGGLRPRRGGARHSCGGDTGIRVCGVYPAYVDTPTYLESASYTGRALRPVPPVVPPERVAGRIVRLALRPPRAAPGGAPARAPG